jgi:hypothetical protein
MKQTRCQRMKERRRAYKANHGFFKTEQGSPRMRYLQDAIMEFRRSVVQDSDSDSSSSCPRLPARVETCATDPADDVEDQPVQ